MPQLVAQPLRLPRAASASSSSSAFRSFCHHCHRRRHLSVYTVPHWCRRGRKAVTSTSMDVAAPHCRYTCCRSRAPALLASRATSQRAPHLLRPLSLAHRKRRSGHRCAMRLEGHRPQKECAANPQPTRFPLRRLLCLPLPVVVSQLLPLPPRRKRAAARPARQ